MITDQTSRGFRQQFTYPSACRLLENVIKPHNLMRKVVPNPRRRVEPFVNLGKSAVSSVSWDFLVDFGTAEGSLRYP